jgi:hypothetical protein
MIAQLTKKFIDCSEKDSFIFTFCCDRCGRELRSTPIPFSKGGFSKVEDDETLKLLWADEHRAAFERANLEVMFHFSHCDICGKWVCDECFYTSEDEYTDVCKDCRAQTEESHGAEGRVSPAPRQGYLGGFINGK